MNDLTLTQKNSLGLAKRPGSTRVVVAMSGGVDSSVVAAKLKREGYDVVGITLQLYDHGQALAKKGACCAGTDIHDARRVAEDMGFPHYVLDYENRFRDAVIEEFADQYLAGATPIPCIRCNERVKFRDLLETAKELDADCLATGHYIQRFEGPSGAELHRAADPNRDQSYFLFSTTREQLEFLRFPLGHLKTKAETRAMAAEFGLSVADKPDSQDICFVPGGSYAAVIEKLRPGAARPGGHRASGWNCPWRASGHHPLHDRPASRPGHRRRRPAVRRPPRCRTPSGRRGSSRSTRNPNRAGRDRQLVGRQKLRRPRRTVATRFRSRYARHDRPSRRGYIRLRMVQWSSC